MRLHPLKNVNVSNDLRIANKIISHFPVNSLQELSDVVYAVATVVSIKNGFQLRSEGTRLDVTPAWKIRLQRKIESLRCDVNQLQAVKRGCGRLTHQLISRHHITSNNAIDEALELSKQKLLAMSSRLSRYNQTF